MITSNQPRKQSANTRSRAKAASKRGAAAKKPSSKRSVAQQQAVVLGPIDDSTPPAGAIVTASDLTRWNTTDNVRKLATVMMSETSMYSSREGNVVGFTVLNRMKRNGKQTVDGVWGAFAHNQTPTTAALNQAKAILGGNEADWSGGTTHFYSPRSMPKEGESTAGYDVGGGLEQTPGLDKKNYRPSWALTYTRVSIGGVEEKRFKFYRAPGSGSVL